MPMVVPLHPRTRKRLKEQGLWTMASRCTLLDPLGYVDLLSLAGGAAFVVTDSGGLQKEAYYADKRCAVGMPDTGWSALTDRGWNMLVAPDAEALAATCHRVREPFSVSENIYGNGRAAHKIIAAVQQLLG